MDNILDDGFESQDFRINKATISHLAVAAKWAKFLAIVGFIIIVLMLLVIFSIAAFFSIIPGISDVLVGGDIFGSVFTIISLIGTIIAFFPTLYLYRFAKKTEEAIKNYNSAAITVAFKSLKVMFRFIGVYMIVVLGFYVLAIVVATLA